MRIFLTGATGYLGGALALRLAAAGREVRALVRSSSRPAAVAALRAAGVATFEGDVTDRASLREGMSGADWVVHAAADLDLSGPAERMTAVNVAGSENVASLAWKLGVARLLAISSIAAFGGSPDDGRLADESTPQQPPPSRYSATKRAGDVAIAGWAARGLAVTTVYPSLVYGPPGKREGANAILRQLLRRRMPVRVGGDRLTSWIFLDDLLVALERILAGSGAPGRGYLLAGDVARLDHLIAEVCRLGGVAPPRLAMPLPAVRAAAAMAGPLYRLAGRRPPFIREQLKSLSRHWGFSDERARRELAWTPRTLAEGLPPTVAFLQAAAGAPA